jgi:Sulfotransferase family
MSTVRCSAFPFFVGCGRSGTTLLRAIFDSHPDLAVPDEVSFVIRLARPHYALRYGWPVRYDAARGATLITANASWRRWGLPVAASRAALADPPPASFPAAVRRAYGQWAASAGKARYADKTPMHVSHLPRLARMFPEARFVHLVRDGRDVALSYRSVGWGPATVTDAALLWRRRVAAGRRAGHRIGPGRYREVRYEDLVAEPERVVRELCAFLDLAWDDALLRYPARAGEVIAATRFPSAHDRLRLPPTPGLRDWRRDMDPADVAAFEAVAGRELAAHGYPPAGPAPSVAARAGAEARRVAAAAGRAWDATRAGARVLVRRAAT